ncbi:unnamed protein product [Linum trigynum]|uniref:Retrotransposon Copia-like N-terminal domain-containing protein n=1 Tax=Linum trigynum TaxID=586398 RepID=A0AAV2FWH0_9ROSI
MYLSSAQISSRLIMEGNSGESVINLNDPTQIIALNPASQLPTKLSGGNFPTWRAQLFTLLRGLDLLRFLDGTHPEPAATASADVRTHWFQQDQLLLHAILASVSPAIAPYVSDAATSRQAWTILERMFPSQSRQRVINLKDKLSQEKQGNRPVSVYLQAMRTTVAELALVNAPVAPEDLILHVLRGLQEEFGPLAAAVRARDTTIQLEDLHDRLVDYEADLARLPQSVAPTTAFSSIRGRSQHPFSRSPGQHRRGSTPPPSYASDTYSRRESSPRSPHGHYSPRSSQGNYSSPPAPSILGRPQLLCQFCDKTGH